MSMHEFEDLVEASIRLLARSAHHSHQERRSLYWNLYEFQALFDTGFTHFRVLELLLAAGYTYRFDLCEHPDYQQAADFFQRLHAFSFLYVHPTQPWNGEQNPMAGYYQPPFLYCDVNSPLWARFVRQGRLTGEDALAVERLDPLDLAHQVVEEAFLQQDFWLVAQWYMLLTPYLLMTFDEQAVTTLMELESLNQIKRRFYQTAAHTIELGSYGYLRRLTPEELDEEESPILSWWLQAP